jgi:beta-barrel assembly-enhancing protease
MKSIAIYLAAIGLMIHLTMGTMIGSEARLRKSDLTQADNVKSDIKAEIRFGRDLAARILASHPLLKDATIQRYVNLVGNSVAMNAGRPELKFHFGILESQEVNAFAVPGGYIFITSAALFRLKNEAELAGVLAHEIGHIVAKHMVKELKIRGRDESTMAGLSAIIGGSTASFREAFDQAVDEGLNILFQRGYKMEDELEADRIGVILTAFCGYDPSGLKQFILRTKHFETPSTDVKGDHPAHMVRANAINKAIKANGITAGNYLQGEKRFNEMLAD